MSETKNKFKQLLPYFFLAFAIIAVYRVSGELEFFSNFFGRVWSIISPFFYGFMLAYIINIPISGIQKLINKSKNKLMIKRQRMFSVIAVFAILAGLIALALAFIVPAIERSVEFFRENAESYWQGVLRVIDDFNNLGLFGIYIDDEFIFGILGNFLSGFTTENLAQLINEIIGVGEAIFAIIIAFISSIYILIEKDEEYHNALKQKIEASDKVNNIKLLQGDCNELLKSLNGKQWYSEKWRGVIFLDPYAMELDWESLTKISNTRAFDMWYLFPYSAVTRNLENKGNIPQANKERLDRIFGTENWKYELYKESAQLTLFGDSEPSTTMLIQSRERETKSQYFPQNVSFSKF